MPDAVYTRRSVQVPPQAKLYLFSDGAFEIDRPAGGMLRHEEFLDTVRSAAAHERSDVDRLFNNLIQLRGSEALEDDVSIVRFSL